MKDKKTLFELKLIVIAILIPLFLVHFPKIINQIIFPPFKFLVPLFISYSLGFFWFLVLLIGLYDLAVEKKPGSSLFKKLFQLVVYVTLASIIIVVALYFFEAISFAINLLSPMQVILVMRILMSTVVIISAITQFIIIFNLIKKKGGIKK